MSDTSNSEEIYQSGKVPADADLNPDGGDVVESETHVTKTETTTHSTEGHTDNG